MEISTKKYHIYEIEFWNSIQDWVFLPPFTGGKKCLEFPLGTVFTSQVIQ